MNHTQESAKTTDLPENIAGFLMNSMTPKEYSALFAAMCDLDQDYNLLRSDMKARIQRIEDQGDRDAVDTIVQKHLDKAATMGDLIRKACFAEAIIEKSPPSVLLLALVFGLESQVSHAD